MAALPKEATVLKLPLVMVQVNIGDAHCSVAERVSMLTGPVSILASLMGQHRKPHSSKAVPFHSGSPRWAAEAGAPPLQLPASRPAQTL
jgi:hypothetical protein